MIGLSYPGFIVPIHNVDEYNDFVTTLPFSSSVKRRLSTSNRSTSVQNTAQPREDFARPNRTGVMKRLRLLVDERIRLKRGYVNLQRWWSDWLVLVFLFFGYVDLVLGYGRDEGNWSTVVGDIAYCDSMTWALWKSNNNNTHDDLKKD